MTETVKMIRHLDDLTVVTQFLAMANILADINVNILRFKGNLNKPVLSLVGRDTEATFDRIEVPKLF